MLLDDSLELDAVSPSKQADLVPMLKWHDIQLSDIWIPSGLLLNRQGPSRTFSNEHRSAIFHTLVKHEAADSLSVYPDAEIGKSRCSSSEKLLDSLEELSEKCRYTENTLLPDNIISDNSPASSIADYLEHLNISDDEEENSFIRITTVANNQEISANSQSYSNVESLEVYSNKNSIALMPEVNYLEHLNVSDDEGEKSSVKVNDEQDSQKISLDAQKDSNVEKLFQAYEDRVSATLGCDLPTEADTCPLNKVAQDSENSDELVSSVDSDQMVDLFELSEKLWNDSRLHNESPIAETADLNLTDSIGACLDKSSEFSQNPDDLTEMKISSEEPVEFPFLLQKSNDEDLSSVAIYGKNNKKEKKSKKKAPKNIPLDNFFRSKEEASSEIPKAFLEFEESLRQKLGFPDPSERSKQIANNVFPSLTELNVSEESSYVENNCLSLTTNPVLDSPPSSSKVHKNIMEDDSNITKYVIENIPLSVDEEMLQSLLVTYDAEVMKVEMKQSGKTLKAIIEIIVEEPSWIIECLNGNQPFGASCGSLKCYQVL